MAYQDLRDFLTALEARQWLHRVEVEVDPYLEIAHITDRVCKKKGPALLFTRVKGFQIPVVTNLLGSYERLNLALGVSDLAEAGQNLFQWLDKVQEPKSWVDKLKALPKLAKISSLAPKIVKKAPCQEVVETNPSFSQLPVLTTWPQDAGPFLTLPLVITKDQITGSRNLGLYRMQVFDARTAGMHWHLHKDGAQIFRRAEKPLPVAVALGGDPVLICAATAPLPPGVDEFFFAGFLRRQPVELVPCRTIDLEVPAGAEIILEGYVEPGETRLEGPFGDHTGFYSPADYYPVFHLTCLTRRKEPLYPATVVGRPPMEDTYLGKATERLFLPLIKLALPEVVDLNLVPEGGFHNLAIVSIDKRYPGQAYKVMQGLWGMGQMMLTKTIIVLDAPCNVHDLEEVIWLVSHHVDPQRDLFISRGPLDALDHAAPQPYYGSKLGVDATKKLPEEGHPRPWPEEMVMQEDIVQLVTKRWQEYGF